MYEWHARAIVQSGTYVHTAYDFTKPKMGLETQLNQPMSHAEAEGEIYDYPGPHLELGHGDTIAKIRLEEQLAGHARMLGKANVEGLFAGCLFKLADYPRDDQNREYLVVKMQHEIWEDEYRTGVAPDQDEVYLCNFEAMPSAQPYRPPRTAHQPTVAGPQTAVVTGPPGEEIHTDKYGRVKVQFHWDRVNPSDQTSSCWVRVSQIWAGSGYGWITIPRIGQEVVVDFLEGDPDRPIITGRIYNANQMPPYGLPANATQSGIKSNSSKGGGGSNEIRFEDKKGDEQVYIHAQKNQDEVVENDKTQVVHHDETLTVDNNRTRLVGVDESVTIGNNQTIAVGVNQTETVGSNRSDSVGMNETRSVGLFQQMSIGAARNVSVGAAQAHEIGAIDSWSIGASRSTDIGLNETLDIGNNRTTTIGDNESLKIGENQSVDVGKTISVQAGDEISLTTGKASIVMKKDGTITIKGKDIKIEGSGKIDVRASKNITMKGQKILQN
ncbi:MAG: type VI secretion system tip protein TssI/VgrG [Pseudomonadota bacterium]